MDISRRMLQIEIFYFQISSENDGTLHELVYI